MHYVHVHVHVSANLVDVIWNIACLFAAYTFMFILHNGLQAHTDDRFLSPGRYILLKEAGFVFGCSQMSCIICKSVLLNKYRHTVARVKADQSQVELIRLCVSSNGLFSSV